MIDGSGDLCPNAARFAPLPTGSTVDWFAFFSDREESFFPSLVGLRLEEVRTDYARMRLPYRPASCTAARSPP